MDYFLDRKDYFDFLWTELLINLIEMIHLRVKKKIDTKKLFDFIIN